MECNYKNTPKEKWSANDYADFYRYDWGINSVPSNGCQLFKGDKVPPEHRPEPWQKWKDKPIPLELHEKWKREKKFEQGIMRITGNIWHRADLKDYLYASIDCDNILAITEFMKNGPVENSIKHVIEMHLGTSGKCHWEFYIKKDSILKNKASDIRGILDSKIKNNDIPAFEVKIGAGVMFGAPSMHPDGTRYELLGIDTPQIVDGNKIQEKINRIYKKYNMKSHGDKQIPIKDMVQSGAIIEQGHDRSQGVLRFIDSLSRRLYELYLPDDYFVNAAFWFYKNHAVYGYTDEKIQSTAVQSVSFIKKQISEENNTKYRKIISGELDEGIKEDCYWMVKFMIKHLRIINKSKIYAKILDWFIKVLDKRQTHEGDILYLGIDGKFPIDKIIKSVFNNEDVVESLKKLASMYAQLNEPILLSKDQHIEAAIYLVEKFHVKRHGLDGRLIYFNGIHYDDKTEAFLYRQMQQLMIRTKNFDLNEVYNKIKIESQIITLEEMRKHSHMICLLNGTYNIKTREFSTIFSPDYYIFDQIPYNYNTDQHFTEIKKFVTALITNEFDRQFYYDFTSICFHPYNGICFQLGLVGPPGTGKTELNKLTGKCFDEDSVHGATVQRISDDATVRFDVALGRLNVDGDMTDMGIKQISNTKKFISQETFTDRPVYDHSNKYNPSSRLMFSANSLYEIPGKDDADAIYDRTKLIKFTKKIRYTEEDIKNYIDKKIPKKEFDGYVTFLLHNASDIWERQDTKYTLDPTEARDIWNETGNHILHFIKKYLIKDAYSTIKALDIYNKWEENVISSNIDKPVSTIEFYKILEERTGREKEKVRLHDDPNSSVVWGYHGLRLRTDDEIAIQEQTRLNDTEN